MYVFRPICNRRKVTRSITGHGKYWCACAHLTGKYKFRLRKRTSRKTYIPHQFVAVSNRTFHAWSRKVSCVTLAREYFRLTWSLQHEPSSRHGYASASISTHLDSTMTLAANFTDSSEIALIPHLLHNILFYDSPKRPKTWVMPGKNTYLEVFLVLIPTSLDSTGWISIGSCVYFRGVESEEAHLKNETRK